MIGTVTSNKMKGVVAVQVERIKVHPLYKKRLRRSKKFLAQTKEALNVGDVVEIKETRPLSRRVRFAVTNVATKAEILPEVKEDLEKKEKEPKKEKAEEKK